MQMRTFETFIWDTLGTQVRKILVEYLLTNAVSGCFMSMSQAWHSAEFPLLVDKNKLPETSYLSKLPGASLLKKIPLVSLGQSKENNNIYFPILITDFDITESHIYRQAYFSQIECIVYCLRNYSSNVSQTYVEQQKQNYVFSCFEHSMLNT